MQRHQTDLTIKREQECLRPKTGRRVDAFSEMLSIV
jgi:hypothetical protein